ncbi:hypothetical protein DL768_002427 [Monosporascus sp. mg162]|nr:hypothetical protein DL768_002427 [Monosporascus sp. mg162]
MRRFRHFYIPVAAAKLQVMMELGQRRLDSELLVVAAFAALAAALAPITALAALTSMAATIAVLVSLAALLRGNFSFNSNCGGGRSCRNVSNGRRG